MTVFWRCVLAFYVASLAVAITGLVDLVVLQ